MSTEKLNFDTYDSGWETGAIADVDEAISGADGAAIGTATKNQVALMGLSASAVVDADTVTGITVVVRARTTGSANDALGVELLIGGVVQGARQDSVSLTASFVNYTFNDVAWDADRTEAEMDGMQIRLHSRQSGMPGATGHEVDCADVDVAFDPPGGGETASGDGPVPAVVAAGIAFVNPIVEIANSPAIANSAVATFITVTHGMSFSAGDVIVITYHINESGVVLSAPAGKGFTKDFSEDGDDTNQYAVFSKVSNGTEDASWTFTTSGAAVRQSIIVRAFKGADSSIWDVAPAVATRTKSGGSSTPAVAPSMTTLTDGALGLVAVFTDSPSITYSNPSNGYGNEAEATGERVQVSYTRIFNNSGVTGVTNVDLSASNDWVAHQFALKPDTGVVIHTASGDGAVPAIEAAGVAKVHRAASGSAEIGAVEAAGTANVGGAHTASGDGQLPVIEAAGVAKVHRAASGGGTLGAVVAAGTATVHRAASGSALLAAVIAAGNATVHRAASGAASLASVEAAGSATVGAVEVASGDGPLPAIEAAGVAKLHRAATGSAAIAAIEAAGTATVHRVASGAAFIGAIVANGLAKVVKLASGAATMAAVSASGVAVAGGATIASSVELDARILDISLDAQQITPNLDAKI